MKTRKQMIAAFTRQLEEMDEQIQKLENKFLSQEDPAPWGEYKRFFELIKQRDEAAGKLENIRNSPPETWEELKNELQQIMNDLRGAYFEFRFPGDQETPKDTF